MNYQIVKGTKFYGSQTIFENIKFEISHNEKIAIVGRNGAGKTTLLKIIAGVEELESGEIHKPSNCKIGYLSQTTFVNENNTLQTELLEVFKDLKSMKLQLENIENQMISSSDEQLLQQYASLLQRFEEMGGYSYEYEMKTMLSKFKFQEEDLHRTIDSFSGGQKTRLAFVKLLLSKPSILLLDEPTNHLDLDTIQWLEDYIRHYPKAVVIVSHDRMFLDKAVNIIYELEFQTLTKYYGNYASYLEQKRQNQQRKQAEYRRQQKEIERLEKVIEKFSSKSSKAGFVKSKMKYLERMNFVEQVKVDKRRFHAHFVSAIRGGERVLTISNLTIGYDQPLCNIDLQIMRGQKIAIIGPNGQGKSTFLKTLMRQVEPFSGEFLYGHQIEVGYFDQTLAQLNATHTVLEEVWGEFEYLTNTEVRTILGNYLFTQDDVLKPVNCLSGGEKVRLAFVKLTLLQPNFLLLDEPTNHLDLQGKEALEECIKGYDGTMLFVSHDRYFIKQIATDILVIENKQASHYAMNYEDYLQRREKEIETTNKNEKKVYKKSINYKKKVQKIESEIEEKEAEIKRLKEMQFLPEIYENYEEMNRINDLLDNYQKELENLYIEWESYINKL